MNKELDMKWEPRAQSEKPTGSIPEGRRERKAIRHVTLLLILRGLIVIGGVLTAMLVPRTLGPATYGRYDLITMLTFWFTLLAGLGTGQVLSRQVPQLEHEGSIDKLRAIFGSLLVLRTFASALAAILYFIATRVWLWDLDWRVFVVLSVAVILRGPASLCYSLFLGQERIGRWAIPEMVRQWGSVMFSLPCFLVGGLLGAVTGYLVSETLIFTIGILGARRVLSRSDLRFDGSLISPLVKVGLGFYAADLVLSAFDRSGAVLIRALTQDYAQVGLFGVSYQIFLAAVLCLSQISTSFVPLLTILRTEQENAELKLWIERLVKWLTVATALGFLGSLILGKVIVTLVLGRAYLGAANNLVVLAATLMLLPLTNVCGVLALTHDRPGIVFKAAALRLLGFLVLGIPLISKWGSFGACLSMLIAVAIQASYFTYRNWSFVMPALLHWMIVVGIGLLFAPLAWLRGSNLVNLSLYILAAGGYLVVLRALGTISARELHTLYAALRFSKEERQEGGEAGS
jgi:O-antigen/teichoic acid export membrane protein